MTKARPSKRVPQVVSEKRRLQMKAWYAKNREAHIKACRAWTVAHPELAREYWRQAARRARAKASKAK